MTKARDLSSGTIDVLTSTDITTDGITTNTAGTSNFVAGVNAGNSIVSGGNYNTVVGDEAGTAITTADSNTAFGFEALKANTTGASNTASGHDALYLNTTGSNNTASGYSALFANTTGSNNTSVGHTALRNNTTGSNNAAVGKSAGQSITTGARNNCFGVEAAVNLTTGIDNTFIGKGCSPNVTTGSGNIAIGDISIIGTRLFNLTSENDRIIMGHHNITNAYVKVAWTVTSDARDKADVVNFTHGLDYITQLRPVNYVWDERSSYADGIRDGSKKKDLLQLGFLAQEIEAVETSLGITNNCVVDKEDVDNLKITETKLIPILVKAIQELSTQNAALEARITALEA